VSDPRPDEHLLIASTELMLISAGPDGAPHETPLRFVYQDGVVCLLANPGADWYDNVERDRGVVMRVQRRAFRGRAKVYGTRQRAQMVEALAALFERKYGAAAARAAARGARPVTIDVQF